MTKNEFTLAGGFNIEQFGWKYYNQIRKKAMEQEFSWSGLVLSLSIAFFVVISASSLLRATYISMEKESAREKLLQQENIYKLEVFNNTNKYIQPSGLKQEKIEGIASLNLA